MRAKYVASRRFIGASSDFADARAEGWPPGRDLVPRVGAEVSVCDRAFHAGTPVCSGGCIGSHARTRSRSVRGVEIEG